MKSLALAVPGSIAQRTGGYVYDARLLAELRALGHEITLIELDGDWPSPSMAAREATAERFAALADGTTVVTDALAGSVLPELMAAHADRLNLVALLHHPLALETGLAADEAQRLARDERAALAHARLVIVTSQATAGALQRYDVPAERIVVAEPGVDQTPVAEAFDGGRFHWCCVATITPRKAHRVLIDAFDTIAARAPALDWSLTLVGSTTRSPDTAAELRERITEATLSQRVHLVGEADEISLSAHYAAAHGFTLASAYEGYGMVLSEAIARALPIVATRGGAMVDTVPPAAGLLVAVGDVAALADALQDVMTSRPTYARLREGALAARSRLPRWSSTATTVSRALERTGIQA